MEHRIEIVGGKETIAKLRKHVGSPQQRRIFLQRASIYMRKVTGETFRALRHGGTYRGVTWKYFANQYTRKTDGVVVPAAGGVPRLAHKAQYSGTRGARASALGSSSSMTKGGNGRASTPYKKGERSTLLEPTVRGRLRPSGQRVKEGDSIMQDSRTLHNSVVVNWDIERIEDRRAAFGTGLRYAPLQAARRPFLFYEKGVDVTRLTRIYHQSLKEAANDGGA